MTDKFMDKYRIPSARWQNWDYGSDAAYYITICTYHREHYFGEIENGKMCLSHIGVLADVFWHEIKNHAKNIELDSFVVMPNHIHGILILNGNNAIIDNGAGTGVMTGSGTVETRHALSLQQPNPNQPPNQHSLQSLQSLQSSQSLQSLQSSQSSQSLQSLQSLQPPQPSQSIQSSLPIIIPGQQRFQNQGKNTISSIIGSYKSAISKHTHRLGYKMDWQSRFYDHIIRDDAEYCRIADYIETNVAKWTNDEFFNTEYHA